MSAVNKLFTQLKIEYNKGIWKASGSKVDSTVIESMLQGNTPGGVTPKELMDAYVNPTQPTQSFDASALSSTYIDFHEFDDTNWSEVDDMFFSQIRYSIASQDGTIMYFIKSGNEYKPLIFGANRDSNIAQLVRVSHESQSNYNFKSYGHFLANKWQKAKDLTTKHLLKASGEVDTQINVIKKYFPLASLQNTVGIYRYWCETEDASSGKKTRKTVKYRVRGLKSTKTAVSVWDYLYDSLTFILTLNQYRIDFPKIYTSNPEEEAMKCVDLKSYMKDGECPTWDFYLKRFTNDEAEVLKAFIYSIFDSGNNGRQALYIYDSGFTGKSVMTNAIAQALGQNLVGSLQKDSLSNQFGLSKIWDKRLVIIDDNKNAKLIHTEKIHMLLGMGQADIEMKGKNSFSCQLQSKLIISGNIKPEIDPHARHELTRVILIKPQLTDEMLEQVGVKNDDGTQRYDTYGNPVLAGDPEFKGKLVNEFQVFLSKCKISYDKLCPTRSNIVLPESVHKELYNLGSDEDCMYDELEANYLSENVEGFITKKDLMKIYMSNAEEYMLQANNIAYSNFRNHLIKKYDLKDVKKRINGRRVLGYLGINKIDDTQVNSFEDIITPVTGGM